MNRARLILVAALVVAGCGPAPLPSQTSSPLPSASALPSASPLPSGSADAGGWTALELPEVIGTTRFSSIVAVGTDLVVIGEVNGLGAAWTSTGGGPWSVDRLPGQGSLPGRAIRWGKRVLVAGGGQSNRCAHPASDAFWLRDADAAWHSAPFDQLLCADGGAGELVVGPDRALNLGMGFGEIPKAWWSLDGLAWHDAGFPADQSPWTGAAFGGGYLAAGRGFDGRLFIARSADGKRWAIDHPIIFAGDATPFAMTPLAGRVLMFAHAGDHIVAWQSADGRAWDPIDVGDLPADVLGIKAIDAGLIAFTAEDPALAPRLLVSRDGSTWRAVALPGAATVAGSGSTINDLEVAGGSAWLIGYVGNGDTGSAAIWTGPRALVEP